MVDEELREIIIKRDDLEEQRFENLIKKCEVIDLYKYLPPDELARIIAEKLANRLGTNEEKLYGLIMKREKDSKFMPKSSSGKMLSLSTHYLCPEATVTPAPRLSRA